MNFFEEQRKKRPLPEKLGQDETLKKILSVIKQELSPSHVFLYGSRANQAHSEYSDYDFVVVIPNSEDSSSRRAHPIKDTIESFGARADIFIYTEEKFHDWKDEFSSTPETAFNTGYEVTHL